MPLLVSTDSVLAALLAVIKSGLPSPFTSAYVKASGPLPTVGEDAAVKMPEGTLVVCLSPNRWLPASWPSRLIFISPAPFPTKVPPLVRTCGGSWGNERVPVRLAAFKLVSPLPLPEKALAVTVPLTWSLEEGLVVPMPTLPAEFQESAICCPPPAVPTPPPP